MMTRRVICFWGLLCTTAFLLWSFPSPGAESPTVSTLVPAGAVWKFLDNGSDQGVKWRGTNFNDNTWRSGPAQLGYGDNDESTVVSYGPSSSAKYITTYFRHRFLVPDASLYSNLILRVLRDDGAVVYLNSNEVYRANVAPGTISSTNRGLTVVGNAD